MIIRSQDKTMIVNLKNIANIHKVFQMPQDSEV